MSLYKQISTQITLLKEQQALRQLKAENEADIKLNLSTNDYLSLAENQNVKSDFLSGNTSGLTASSSRLLSGNHSYYTKVENLLSELYLGREALFFNSGYHLNIGVLPALTGKNDLILADKLVHASLIEGTRLSYAKTIRYRHLDYQHLESLLQKYQNQFEHIFIVTESVFSMDGDVVDLRTLVKLKERFGAYLYVDEAHAVGAIGDKGLGCVEKEGLITKVDFIVGTMGKALASVGAYLISDAPIKSYLLNKCRSLIYTTALPPINMAWTEHILELIPNLKEERNKLEYCQQYLRQTLDASGIEYLGESHILAIVLGDNRTCLMLTEKLKLSQIQVQAIRPPTVPENTARLRLSLKSSIKPKDIDLLVDVLKFHIPQLS